MKKVMRRLSAFFLALALIVTAGAAQLLTVEAVGTPPTEITECISYFGYDFAPT